MSRAGNKFLTTHVGSLPRPEELTRLMFAREDGLPFDSSALDEQVTRAVELVVARQLNRPMSPAALPDPGSSTSALTL